MPSQVRWLLSLQSATASHSYECQNLETNTHRTLRRSKKDTNVLNFQKIERLIIHIKTCVIIQFQTIRKLKP